jgi:Ni,Fe-hydrogenase I large subunit
MFERKKFNVEHWTLNQTKKCKHWSLSIESNWNSRPKNEKQNEELPQN